MSVGLFAGSLLVFVTCCWAKPESRLDTLDVKWGTLKEKEENKAFFNMPRTLSDAVSSNFVPVPESAGDCEGKFAGQRYYKKGDTSVILLFDKSGHVAGIQSGYPKSKVNTNATLKTYFERQRQTGFFQDDTIGGVDTFTITAYFYDPSTICSEPEKGGKSPGRAVDRLSFQTGSKPQENLRVPLIQSQLKIPPIVPWSAQMCFPRMGYHYYFNTSVNMDCNEFRPVLIMYQNGRLVVFGFVVFGHFPSDHYEYFTDQEMDFFFDATPKCLIDQYDSFGGYTSMHVYLKDPLTITC